MHSTLINLIEIKKKIQLKIDGLIVKRPLPKIIAVSKTHSMPNILPLINCGHLDYGENKVQEAIDKWTKTKTQNKNIKLHLIGPLQTNKVKFVVKIFDYIHSVDREKLAIKIADEQTKQGKKIKIFIQINIANEEQKSGVKKKQAANFLNFCKDLNLDVIGTMCIPPKEGDSQNYFLEMNKINKKLNLSDLSMGMSEDYLKATENNATYLRIGSKIFGQRN
jgi:pyridoxal phosphate enzyme (YggS family)